MKRTNFRSCSPLARLFFGGALGVLAIVSLPAQAQVITGTYLEGTAADDGTAYFGNIQNNDLIEGLTPNAIFTQTASGYTAGNAITTTSGQDGATSADGGTNLSGINDGGADNNFNGNAGASANSNSTLFGTFSQTGLELLAAPQLTYTLAPTAGNTGYTLTSITSIFGYNGYSTSLSDQNYTVSYSTVEDPTTFLLLATVDYDPFDDETGDASTSQVTLTSLGVTNVAAIRFTFTEGSLPVTDDNRGQHIDEIDVDGIASAPEPSTCVMMLGGVALLGFCVQRQSALGRRLGLPCRNQSM